MNDKYYPPEFLASKFHCLRCSVYAKQYWGSVKTEVRYNHAGSFSTKVLNTTNSLSVDLPDEYVASKCDHCGDFTLWYDRKIIYPHQTSTEAVNKDAPDEVQSLYNEAALVLEDSPRAAAALLRLALQVLLGNIGGKGKDINTDIATIVKSGVDLQVQKALDVLRVFGNNGSHPGEIKLDENPELVKKMFGLLNFVITKLISQRKEIDGLFDSLPETVKKQVQKRDGMPGVIDD